MDLGRLLLFEGGLRLVNDSVEGGDVDHGEVGEDFAVEGDPGGIQSFDEA